MTDNFKIYEEYISSYIPQDREDVCKPFCYVVELMRRGKDHPDLPAANYHFKNYYIHSIEHLRKFSDEIKTLCKIFGLRAYASVNYKDMEQIMLDTNAELSRRIALHDFKKPYAIFESCVGKYTSKSNRRFVVDIDDTELYYQVLSIINECDSGYESPAVATFPTKNGVHIIAHPFNIAQFRAKCKECGLPEIDIKQNHLTLLYEDL